jgi:hypothetical protein
MAGTVRLSVPGTYLVNYDITIRFGTKTIPLIPIFGELGVQSGFGYYNGARLLFSSQGSETRTIGSSFLVINPGLTELLLVATVFNSSDTVVPPSVPLVISPLLNPPNTATIVVVRIK